MAEQAPRRSCSRTAKTAISVACAAVIGVLFALASSSSQSDEHRLNKAAVLERGVYRAVSEARPMSQSDLGPVTRVRDASLIESTTTVIGRPSVRFGLRYVITGEPAGAQVQIRLVTRFPEAGLQNPDTGARHHQSEYRIEAIIGARAYREFRFDHQWEIVPGEWVFEFWHGDRMLGAQKFCVISGTPNEPDNALQCAPALTG